MKYWGVGNESWGCGGNMRPEFYADEFRRYQTYCRNYGENRLYRIGLRPQRRATRTGRTKSCPSPGAFWTA